MKHGYTIKTYHVYPPIPIRNHDWVAWVDGEEETTATFAETEAQAIEYLNDFLEEREADEQKWKVIE